MKRITILSLIFLFLISSSAQALDWAYPFLVWKGKVYKVEHVLNGNVREVKQELILDKGEIGKIIGEVKRKANEYNGKYYGDASNRYPIGTKYYEIKGISTSTAIAIQENNKWVKAVYVGKASFNIMNVISNFYFISAVIIIALVIFGFIFRSKKSKNQ